jgi:hypothetical protein
MVEEFARCYQVKIGSPFDIKPSLRDIVLTCPLALDT